MTKEQMQALPSGEVLAAEAGISGHTARLFIIDPQKSSRITKTKIKKALHRRAMLYLEIVYSL